jgi:hypothetical protein
MAIYSDLVIDQGSYFSTIIPAEENSVFDFDLTGYIARGRIKKSYSSSTSIDFSILIVDVERGQIEISLASDVTSTMRPGRYVYDIEIVELETSKVTRIREGQIEITPSVTSNAYDSEEISPQTPVLDGGTY